MREDTREKLLESIKDYQDMTSRYEKMKKEVQAYSHGHIDTDILCAKIAFILCNDIERSGSNRDKEIHSCISQLKSQVQSITRLAGQRQAERIDALLQPVADVAENIPSPKQFFFAQTAGSRLKQVLESRLVLINDADDLTEYVGREFDSNKNAPIRMGKRPNGSVSG